MQRKQGGFTLLEILTSIAIIGILAGILVIAYNGVQARARDADRKADIAAITKAFHIYKDRMGHYMETDSGCGQFGDGNGWINVSGVHNYETAMVDCLRSAGVISQSTKFEDPKMTPGEVCSGLNCYAYSKNNCPDGVYLFYHLETKPQTSTDTDATCAPTYDTSYGYNSYVRIATF